VEDPRVLVEHVDLGQVRVVRIVWHGRCSSLPIELFIAAEEEGW
jgi:hypothetical protein